MVFFFVILLSSFLWLLEIRPVRSWLHCRRSTVYIGFSAELCDVAATREICIYPICNIIFPYFPDVCDGMRRDEMGPKFLKVD